MRKTKTGERKKGMNGCGKERKRKKREKARKEEIRIRIILFRKYKEQVTKI